MVVGHVHRFVCLTLEQDNQLRELEQNGLLSQKVRLRASLLRLSNKGMSLAQLAEHFRRSSQAIRNDIKRYEQHGINGLADRKSPGAPNRLTPAITAFIHEKLHEDRTWNCTLLSQAINEHFSVQIQREALRVKVRALGYTWKRTKYVPTKTADPEIVTVNAAAIETLKKGRPSGS